MIYTLGFAADSAAPLSALDVMPCVFYSFMMLIVMFVSMVMGIGRYDYMDELSPEIQAEYDAVAQITN